MCVLTYEILVLKVWKDVTYDFFTSLLLVYSGGHMMI